MKTRNFHSIRWLQTCQKYWIRGRNFWPRWFILLFISVVTLSGILTIHISADAAQPSAVLITKSYNFENRGLGVRREGAARPEAVSNGKTQLRAFRDVLIVEGDRRSWAALVHLLSQKPLRYGGLLMKTVAGPTPAQYWFSCRAKGSFVMGWRQGGKNQACGEGIKFIRRERQAKSSLKFGSPAIAPAKTPLMIAQESEDELTIIPSSQATLIQTVDSGTNIVVQTLDGSFQVTSTRFPESQLVQKNQQYNYAQNQITPFDAAAAFQRQEVQEFLQEEQWTTPDTPKAISDEIKSQLQSYRGVTPPSAVSKPVEVDTRLLKATIYLNSPETILKLAYNSVPQDFSSFVRSNNAAIVASGTFAFGKDWQLISEGQQVAGNFRFTTGTVLGIRRGNQPEMVTLKKEGLPNWDDYWFALAAGPRLLKAGQILPWQPQEEGFADPKVTNTETALGRAAIGFSADRTRLYYVLFKQNVSLRRAAELMKQIGCAEAMNLEGGGTRSFAHNGKILEPGGRPQTHALVVHDVNRPAPSSLKQAWARFQRA